MASVATTRTSLDNALKVVYAGPLHNQIVTDSELANIFEADMNVQEDTTTGGRYVEMGHIFGLPAGVGARAEGEYIPEADDPVFKAQRAYLRKIMGTLEMTGDVMERVTGDEGAYIDYADRALPLLAERVVSEFDRMYIGTGKGIRARILSITSVVGTVGTFVVDRSMGITGLSDAWLQFMDGERIVAASDAAATTIRTGGGTRSVKVTSIDDATNSITVTGLNALLVTWAVNDYLFGGDEAGISSVTAAGENREVSGLFAGVDDGNIVDTYMNIQRTASGNMRWKSRVINAAAAPFNGAMSEDLLTFADDAAYVANGAKIDTLVMSRSANRGYWKSLKGERMFMDPRGSFEGGKRTNGLKIILGDRDLLLKIARKLPPEVAFGLTRSTWKRLTTGKWKWDDRTGAIWNRTTDAVGRKDAFYGTGYTYEELLTTAPMKNFRIDGLLPVQ